MRDFDGNLKLLELSLLEGKREIYIITIKVVSDDDEKLLTFV